MASLSSGELEILLNAEQLYKQQFGQNAQLSEQARWAVLRMLEIKGEQGAKVPHRLGS